MRILRVDIGSYGRIRDRHVPISSGLTVIHGPNESGKTTFMEFIRNTMVPTNKRDVYPERAKTDSGSITFEEDGSEGTMPAGVTFPITSHVWSPICSGPFSPWVRGTSMKTGP